jgi:glycosyltransferase involved in cell wall biosynthesis
MKLAVISNVTGYRWAGSETTWHRAALQALAAGHQVTAILHPDLAASEQAAGFVRAGGRIRLWRRPGIARLQPLQERFRPNFPSSLLDGFDSILVSLGSLPALCNVPGLDRGLLRTSARFVLFCQFNAEHLPISPRERDTVAAILRRSACCIFVARRNLDDARRQFAVSLPDARVIGNPIRQVLAEPMAWPEPEIPAHFACVARFETAWKGQDLLLDVLRQAPWRVRDWHLTFYGEGPDSEHLRRLAAHFGLSDRVAFAGFVSDLSGIWTSNHLLLLPSHGEGLPLAALEAMMFGRPIVATDVGGNAEIVVEGVTGFLADAPTVRSFQAALERAWQGRARWAEIGWAAHQKASQLAAADATGALLGVWTGTTGGAIPAAGVPSR